MTPIPDFELDLLGNAVDAAIGLAAQGRIADGYGELSYGLERAQAAREEGEEWAEGPVTRYRLALDNYCESYGVARSGPPCLRP